MYLPDKVFLPEVVRPVEPTPDSGVVEYLKLARKRIEKGWCQNTLQDGDRVCMLGAFDLFKYPRDTWVHRKGAVCSVIMALGYTNTMSMVAWNDRPERTKEDVLSVFDKAIRIAKSQTISS